MTFWTASARESDTLLDLLTLGTPEGLYLVVLHAAPPCSLLCPNV